MRSSADRKPVADSAARAVPLYLLVMVVVLFFAFGFLTQLKDPLLAKLRGLFSLSYAEAMLTQFAFFIGFFVFSIPAGQVLGKVGYIKTIALGLIVMAIGCVLFAPAAMIGSFYGFLGAIFILAAGITTLQVSANSYISVLGPAKTASSRLNLAQGFNSFGTFVAPFVGAAFVLNGGVGTVTAKTAEALQAARVAGAETVMVPFVVIAVILALFAAAFWAIRHVPSPRAGSAEGGAISMRLLKKPRLTLGVVSIFMYVGAEVTIGSVMTNYLLQDSVIGAEAARWGVSLSWNAAQVAGALVAVYWGLAMVGRFIGSAVMRKVSPAKVLCFNAAVAVILALLSSQTVGMAAAITVLVIGLANSIMFPTIFSLGLEGLGEDTAGGSSLLCMGMAGGALVPVVYGAVADVTSLATALLVPCVCYLIIAGYGVLNLCVFSRRHAG